MCFMVYVILNESLIQLANIEIYLNVDNYLTKFTL